MYFYCWIRELPCFFLSEKGIISNYIMKMANRQTLFAALWVALFTLGRCAPFTLSGTSYKQGVGEGLWTYTVPPLANGNYDYYLEVAICYEFLNTSVGTGSIQTTFADLSVSIC